MRIPFLTVVSFAAASLAGCAFTIDKDGGWLPLVGAAPSVAPAPMAATDSYGPGMYVQGRDGRVWATDGAASSSLILRSLEVPSMELDFPGDASLVDDGVLAVTSLDDPSAPNRRFRIEVDALVSSIPAVTHDIELGESAPVPPVVRRGVGYVVYEDSLPVDDPGQPRQPSIHIVYDDGREDSFPQGAQQWSFSKLSSSSLPRGVFPVAGVIGDARYLLLQGSDDQVAVYDLRARQLRPLFALPGRKPPEQHTAADPQESPLPLQYDATQERVWVCGYQSFTVLLTTGERRDFGFSCIDMRFGAGQDVSMQAEDGTVYALGRDGSTKEPLGKVPPYGIRASSGRALVYTRPGFDDFSGGAFGGWLGDERVIGSGQHAQFSADGKRLRWLEDAAENGVGDLYSFDLQTHRTRHLVLNVRDFAELPDGRLVAVANAVSDGPWNRVIVIDEDKGETRWVAKGYSRLVVLGDDVVAARQQARWESILLRVPARQ